MAKKSQPKKNGNKRKPRNLKRFIVPGLMAVVIVVLIIIIAYPQSGVHQPTTTASASTIQLLDYKTGKDKSDTLNVTLLKSKTATLESFEDLCDLDNFEVITGYPKIANKISIDISGMTYLWVHINPSNYSDYANTYRLINGDTNGLFKFYVYRQSSNVSIACLDMSTFELTSLPISAGTNDYTIIANVPIAEKDTHCQAPIYDPEVDTEKDFVSNIETITESYCILFDFNTTVSYTDDAVNEVNMTIDSINEEVVKIKSSDLVAVVFPELLSFDSSLYLPYTLELGANIQLDSIKSCRVTLPEDDNELGAIVTTYQTL